jgi:2-desacetyl-2-hydroxyethyl bacteriochlorophyllide A dehydrogenase
MKGNNIMKAAIIKDYGVQVEIADVPQPEVLENDVLVAVHAASINPIDNIVRAGYMKEMLPITFPYVMGYDVAGVVAEVGSNVTKFKVGDEVYARPNQEDSGSIAEYAVVKEDELALKPKTLSFEEAASFPLAGLTAWQALVSKGNLQKGQKVLIHAGSGGVGTYAIQMAKHLGAEVTTTTSTANVDLVKSLGADHVIDYKTTEFDEVLKDFDLVIDMMGGDILNKSFKVLKKGGKVVSIKGQDTEGLASEYGVEFEVFFMWPSSEMLAHVGGLMDQGIIKPVIDRSYTFEQTQEAYDYLQTGRAKGKVTIKIK